MKLISFSQTQFLENHNKISPRSKIMSKTPQQIKSELKQHVQSQRKKLKNYLKNLEKFQGQNHQFDISFDEISQKVTEYSQHSNILNGKKIKWQIDLNSQKKRQKQKEMYSNYETSKKFSITVINGEQIYKKIHSNIFSADENRKKFINSSKKSRREKNITRSSDRINTGQSLCSKKIGKQRQQEVSDLNLRKQKIDLFDLIQNAKTKSEVHKYVGWAQKMRIICSRLKQKRIIGNEQSIDKNKKSPLKQTNEMIESPYKKQMNIYRNQIRVRGKRQNLNLKQQVKSNSKYQSKQLKKQDKQKVLSKDKISKKFHINLNQPDDYFSGQNCGYYKNQEINNLFIKSQCRTARNQQARGKMRKQNDVTNGIQRQSLNYCPWSPVKRKQLQQKQFMDYFQFEKDI